MSQVISDAVKWEVDRNYSRDTVTVASGVKLKMLQVVGQTTSTGKYKGFDQDSDTGSENAAGISLAAVDATNGDTPAVILARDSIVVMDELVWPEDIDPAEKVAAIKQLGTLGIKSVGA